VAGRAVVQDVRAWADELGRVGDRIGPRFKRSEPRWRALGYIRGLLGDAERKNGWQMAEQLGEATPDGVQHLLARADWGADAVRDDLTAYVAENLGHADGVLVVDETGFVAAGQRAGHARPAGGGPGQGPGHPDADHRRRKRPAATPTSWRCATLSSSRPGSRRCRCRTGRWTW
jgi:hypothetical protein